MPQHHPGASDEGQDDRGRALAALRARLHGDAQALRTPGDWARCLHLAARMLGEDFANVVLIVSQQPGATMVRDRRQWLELGRQVRRNEKGIEIFAVPPRKQRQNWEDEQPAFTWADANRVTHVWDLSQTTGHAHPALPPEQAPGELWEALCWLARRQGFGVEREPGGPEDGVTFWAARRIRLHPDLSGTQAVWALAHHLGHILMHHTPGQPPGATTAGCSGVRKAEADSVAFIVCARYGIAAGNHLAHPASWAGTDPRAQPGRAVLATGQRITTAAGQLIHDTDRILGLEPATAPSQQNTTTLTVPTITSRGNPAARQARTPDAVPAAPGVSPGIILRARRVLEDAGEFYTGQLAGTWVPAYLRGRGVSDAMSRDWQIGYAPGGWTTLTSHLRHLGHNDEAIETAGLASRSSRGTLIDRFRDRVMLAIHDEHGAIAGFIGRAHPHAGARVPKYLNTPETVTYKKSGLLFGLHQARTQLAHGATPVLAEGPFDAIAVTAADPGRYAGLAPCGTALTSRQAGLLRQAAADLARSGILVAFDSDTAGRKAAVRAYGILSPLTTNLHSAALDGKDPAEILQRDGPETLGAVLRERTQPLSALVIDAAIEPWEGRLRDVDGPYLAMRNAATLIASLLPDHNATELQRAIGAGEHYAVGGPARDAGSPDLAEISRMLPAVTSYQITRVAGRLGFDSADVLAEVAKAVARSGPAPTGHSRVPNDIADGRPAPASLASSGFPAPPLALGVSPEHVASWPAAPPSRPRPASRRPRRR